MGAIVNKKIKSLLADLEKENRRGAKARVDLSDKIQAECNKVFNDSKELSKIISNAEQASNYQMGESGEVESWYYWNGLNDYQEYREYFDSWLSEHGMRADWDNSCLLTGQGESIIIQDDTRHDNGVWLNYKRIIDESEYKTDNEVDEVKRNKLIEAYMEKIGCFPGVFRVDSHGNVFFVNNKLN